MAKSHSHFSKFRATLGLFKLLGHPLRVIILQRLRRSPASASELAQHLPIKRSAVVQHLKLMERAGLVAGSAEGRKCIYKLRLHGLAPLVEWLDDHRNLHVYEEPKEIKTYLRRADKLTTTRNKLPQKRNSIHK